MTYPLETSWVCAVRTAEELWGIANYQEPDDICRLSYTEQPKCTARPKVATISCAQYPSPLWCWGLQPRGYHETLMQDGTPSPSFGLLRDELCRHRQKGPVSCPYSQPEYCWEISGEFRWSLTWKPWVSTENTIAKSKSTPTSQLQASAAVLHRPPPGDSHPALDQG